MKFLIIRLSSIGDIVLTTPVVRCLSQQVPGTVIHYLVKKNFSPIVTSNPFVQKVHIWQDNSDDMIDALKAEKFDVVIDLHHNLRTLKIKSALKVKSFSFNKLNVEKWLMTALKWNRLPDLHIIDRYLQTLSSFGVKNDGAGLDFFIPAADEVVPSSASPILDGKYIAMVTGAAHYTKRLPPHKMLEVLKNIPLPVVLLGGPEDKLSGDELASKAGTHVINTCGMFNLNQSASLVKQSVLVITHDTGLMHIAAAFQKPMVSIWGNTVPAFGMYAYYGARSVADYRAEVNGLRCRPCSKIGYRQCPLKHFKCMEEHDLEAIIRRVNELIR